jgi:hypothetical protein
LSTVAQAVVPWCLVSLIHFRGKIRGEKLPAFLLHPCKSVFIRGSLSESYSAGVLRHAICLSPFWGEDEGEGTFFLA